MDASRGSEEASTTRTTVQRTSDREVVVTRWFDAPARLVFQAWSQPELFRQWWVPRSLGITLHDCEMDVRPGGIFSIDIAVGDNQEVPNLGCFLDVMPMERLVWTSMLFPGYRPAVFDDIPITAIVTLAAEGSGTRYVFTALHRNEADLKTNMESGFCQGTQIVVDQLVEHVLSMK